MSTTTKAIGATAGSGLKLVVVGQGQTRGRRSHLLRLRESLIQELNTVSDGQLYLRLEWAIRLAIDTLKARPAGIEVVQVAQLEPTSDDEHLLQQRAARAAKKKAASATKPISDDDMVATLTGRASKTTSGRVVRAAASAAKKSTSAKKATSAKATIAKKAV